MQNKEMIRIGLGNAIRRMINENLDGVYYWKIAVDNKNNQWAIVLGWVYDSEGKYNLAAKLAYQPMNSVMQCGYDIDWLMPYDKDTGEVDDNEVLVNENTDIEHLLDWFEEFLKRYEELF